MANTLDSDLIVLTKRIMMESVPDFELPLTADQRAVRRARRRTACGRDVLLQLPRDGALRPGDVLSDELESVRIHVIAASEPLLHVSAVHPLELLKAAYHLGNRHVALELQENALWLQDDSVLRGMLEQRDCLWNPVFDPSIPRGVLTQVITIHDLTRPAAARQPGTPSRFIWLFGGVGGLGSSLSPLQCIGC